MMPSMNKVKFVESDESGLPLKRKQVSRACEECRTKKKRCIHADRPVAPHTGQEAAIGVTASRTRRNNAVLRSPATPNRGQSREEDASQAAASQLVELSSRFVGDMNPEGIFLQATTPNVVKNLDLGIWLPPSSKLSTAVPTPGETSDHPGQGGPPTADIATGSELARQYEKARKDYITNECLALLPPEEDYLALKRIYIEKIQPVFPVFTDQQLESNHASSVFGILSKQVIIFAAAADANASRHLRLGLGGPLLDFPVFHEQLYKAMITTVDADMVTNRVDLIRILILLSFFYQPTNAQNRDRAALIFSQAVQHLQTLGVQLQGYRHQRQGDDIDRLFCLVWALDRLNCAFYARPVLLHERDSDRLMDECIDKQPPCFRLFLRIIQVLDKVIPLYRPHQPFALVDIPVIESLIVDAGALKLPISLLGTVEILYHAVSVLSCRQPNSSFSDNPAANDFSYIPHPTINPRRSLSADRIVWVSQNQPICSFPFVPYAVSLALSVQYRKMRYSRTAMFRNRARVIFREIVGVLKDMGRVYSSARVNAALGESILKEMEKTATNLARDEPENATGNREALSSVTRPAQGETTVHQAPYSASGLVTPAPVLSGVMPLDPQPNFDADPAGIDPSFLDNIDLDVDLFGYFDPSFNLGAIDTALEANLHIGVPQNWTVPLVHFDD